MTQEDKELLLVDLCSRLPYGVKVAIEYSEGKYTHIYDLREIDNDTTSELRQQVTIWNYGIYSSVISYPLINCRPYLRPMSNMTEEESNELESITFPLMEKDWDGNENPSCIRWIDIPKYMDFILSHHFDYRGLIEKRLALEAPDGMCNIKEHNKI